MSEELDPEVVADLRLRASSMFDRTRTGAEPKWERPRFVAEWACRNKACRVRVAVTQDAVDQLALCNRWLRDRGETPLIHENEVMVCDTCRVLLTEQRARNLTDRRERIKTNVRIVVGSKNPRDEKDAIAALTKDHHPDVPGLLECVESKAKATPGKRERRGGM